VLQEENQLVLTGSLIEIDALKYTPGGVAVLHFQLAHKSQQVEASAMRDVKFEIPGIAVEKDARLLATAKLGMNVIVSGFMDKKSRLSKAMVLHVTHIEFVSQD